jgi:hypothetical protein
LFFKRFIIELVKKAALIFLAVFLAFPQSISALSLIYPPPFPVEPTTQRAAIWYENGIETLILSTTFRGSAKDFGWLIPVPQKPQTDKASDELFTALDDLTRPKYAVDRGPLEIPLGISGLEEKQRGPSPPTIIETKEVDIFDITVLESKDEKGLTEWLSKNGYSYPTDRDYVIKSYIEQNWYFVVAKVNASSLGYAETYMRDGHTTPLKLTFSSPNIVYPIRLSGPGIPVSKDTGTKVAAYSFEQGTEGFYGTYSAVPLEREEQGTTPPVKKYPRVRLSLDQNNSIHGSSSIRVSATNPDPSQAISAQASLSKLKAGKTYTLSAWAKSTDPKNANAYLAISGATIEYSDKKPLAALANWQRLTLTFVAPSSYATISLNATNFSEGETVNWDAVQVEEGTKATDFTEEILPSTQKEIRPQPSDYVTLLLYVFADHKKELPGFTTSYASWVSEKTIGKLAFTPDGKQPWVDAKQKMYLTKLHRQMKPSEMTTDLIFRDAPNNDPVNAESFPEVSTIRFFAVIILVLLIEVGAIVGFVIYRRKKAHAPSA